ncbi:MAG: LCP family protein [Saccharofermentanales bacterium]|jgi:LCP family protein required for cell wall assembly
MAARRSAKRKRWPLIVFGVILGMLLAVVLLGYAYLRSIIGLRDYEPIDDPIAIETGLERLDVPDHMRHGMQVPLADDKGLTNILIIGTDTRDPESHGRADAIMLLTINDKTKSLHLSSLMRGIYVSIPNDPDPAFRDYYVPLFMLNAAHTWGGPRLLLKTVQRNFRVHVTRYMQTDFDGFQTAIDRVGGVEIVLTDAEAKILNSHKEVGQADFKAGKALLNGRQALVYARIRKIDSDFNRMGRQRKVILALFEKMKSSDLTRLNDSVKALMPCVKTNLTDHEMMQFILKAPQYKGYSFDQLSLPLETYEAMKYIYDLEMYDIDWVKNINALYTFMES